MNQIVTYTTKYTVVNIISLGTSTCATMRNYLSFSYMTFQAGQLWVGLYTALNVQCLWALNVTSSTTFTQTAVYSPVADVCSVASCAGVVYAIFCNTHFVSQVATAFVPVAGRYLPGYQDGPLLQAAFNSPSSLVCYSGLLYVADTNNCVILQVDVLRNAVTTVAGTPGLCQRINGTA